MDDGCVVTRCVACQVAASRRAERMVELHNAAVAAGYNGAQVVAELNRVVVELRQDWDAAWARAMRFYQGGWRDGRDQAG